jgi:Leucine-rich repeat (LRR) protein
LASLRELTKLTSLRIQSRRIHGWGFWSLLGMENLEFLWLANTPIIGQSLRIISHFHELRTLGLGWTQVTDPGLVWLKDLHELEYLGLSGTRVTDAGLHYLAAIPSLRQLDVNTDRVTDAGVAALRRALPQCAVHGGSFDFPSF